MRNILQMVFRYGNWIIGFVIVAALFQLVVRKPSETIDPPKLTEAEFSAALADKSAPVLVKFGATWCPPCRATDIALAEFEKSFPGKTKVIIVDVGKNPELAEKFSVRSIPHSFLFYRGNVIDDQVGGMDVQEIDSWIDKTLVKWNGNQNSRKVR